MLEKIEQWIDNTNNHYKAKRISCSRFEHEFSGYYPAEFLQESFFVVVDEIPKPDFPELSAMGLSEFVNMDVAGITYKNTYYVLEHVVNNMRVHFHELVHVAQWAKLGALGFMTRYITEIQKYGYHNAPLEIMAYTLDEQFSRASPSIDVLKYVAKKLNAEG